MCKQAKANGMVPFIGMQGNLGTNTMSLLFDRSNNNWVYYDSQALNALIEGLW